MVSEPSWPVFIAWSMSSAAPSRTSPTTMRSGRIRSALRTRSRMVISPRPSMFGGRDSSRSTWSWCSWSSAASSIVTMRSSAGRNCDSTLSVVVLPEPVPPLITMSSRPAHAGARAARPPAGSCVPNAIRSSTVYGSAANLRIVSTEPSSAIGGTHRVDPAAVGQAGVDHRARLVDPPADPGHDLVDDPAQVRPRRRTSRRPVRCGRTARRRCWSRPVDHDLGDVRVAQQRLDRPVAEDLVEDLRGDRGPGRRRAAASPRGPAPR